MKYSHGYMRKMDGEPVTIKIRVLSGSFCRDDYDVIDQEFNKIPESERCFDYIEHESGPEIIAWIASSGITTLSIAKPLIEFITAIINARSKGRHAGDRARGKLVLVVRDTYRTATSEEEFVLELYDNEIVTSEQVQKAIEQGLKNRKRKH